MPGVGENCRAEKKIIQMGLSFTRFLFPRRYLKIFICIFFEIEGEPRLSRLLK